jgi:hypothetical protein
MRSKDDSGACANVAVSVKHKLGRAQCDGDAGRPMREAQAGCVRKYVQDLRQHIITLHNFGHTTALILEVNAEICDVRNRRQAGCRIFGLFALMCFLSGPTIAQSRTAILEVNADKVENFLSPTLYGQFAEFMYEGIKGGLSAELIRDRGFDEQPNALGLPRYWERDPDDR